MKYFFVFIFLCGGVMANGMTYYKVTWDTYVPVPCPDYKPDPYGRMSASGCAVNHMKAQPHQKIFAAKEEAERFVADSGWKPGDFSFTGITNFKIEEIRDGRK